VNEIFFHEIGLQFVGTCRELNLSFLLPPPPATVHSRVARRRSDALRGRIVGRTSRACALDLVLADPAWLPWQA